MINKTLNNLIALLPSLLKGLVVFLICIGVLSVCGYFGYYKGKESAADSPALESSSTRWTCSMHPDVDLPGPGKCPACDMPLIPNTMGQEDRSMPLLEMTDSAVALAEITTVPVTREFVSTEIRMVGKVRADETRIKTISAWIPGRLDKLFVDYTGIPVNTGDKLARLYSPVLITAQEELLEAVKGLKAGGEEKSDFLKQSSLVMVESAREKLKLWGMTDEQIQKVEKERTVNHHMFITAPRAGIVIKKSVNEGDYVSTGSKMYTIADLRSVWVNLEAYESDLTWIRYGQKAVIKTVAYPGDLFEGRISFVDPVVNEKNRTVRVRINVPNKAGQLKPGMFVRAIVKSRVAAGGKVMDAGLAGKWISPKHPEIVEDEPGFCRKCNTPLVRAEDLGYVAAGTDHEKPLVIPAASVLITGKRAVVYVQKEDAQVPVFEGREVVLGPRAGDYYIVSEGLKMGERIVNHGNFKIDSALQLQGKPSMMQGETGSKLTIHRHQEDKDKNSNPVKHLGNVQSVSDTVPGSFKEELDKIFDGYFSIQYDLSHDSFSDAVSHAGNLLKILDGIDSSALDDVELTLWSKGEQVLLKSVKMISSAEDISTSREAFVLLSDILTEIAELFGTSGNTPVYQYHCSMAFDNRGASWLQNKKGVENPFYGAAMFMCGSLKKTLVPGVENTDGTDGVNGNE